MTRPLQLPTVLLVAVGVALGAAACDPGAGEGSDSVAEGGPADGAPPVDADHPGDAATPGSDGETNDATRGTPDDSVADADATPTVDAYAPEGYEVPRAAPPSVRRLSGHELELSYAALLGLVPNALAQAPPDARDHAFDRIVNDQTISATYVEAFHSAAQEAAGTLLAERRWDDLTPACADALMPPPVPSHVERLPGIALTASPDWALVPGDGHPDRLLIRYAPDCGASATFPTAASGTFRVTLEVEFNEVFDVELSVDGRPIRRWNVSGVQQLTADVELDPGNHSVAFGFTYREAGNPYVWLQSLSFEGPLDLGAASQVEARRACAVGVVDTLGPRAFRRPLTADERARLVGLYDGTLATGAGFADALSATLRGLLQSPHFLYLVEGGAPVAGGPGRFELDDWALAARLSYALCEGPPDEILRARAAAGDLHTGAALREEAERLLGLPCARATLARFYRQWLWLDRLPTTAKDPALYPEFSTGIALSLAAEADRFLEAATFDDGLDLGELLLARHSYLDAAAAQIYDVPAPAGPGLVRTELPPERAGLLTLPGILAVTSKFSQTSPVIRGVYILEQILCEELPAPPDDVDTTPPALDPTATSRERWAAHSASSACAPCHERIDPIGFTFEGFDATGRHRTTENGLPIDTRGAAPALGIFRPELSGARELAELIASSERATTCLSRQWLRFALGRMEEEPDAASVAEVAAALRGVDGSLLRGFVTLTGTRAFRERVERRANPEGEP